MSRNTSFSLLILIVFLGFILRIHNLDGIPLRGDEAFSAFNWAQMPINQSLSEIATIEPHPPLTYVFFHIWNLIIGGIESPFALRLFGVLINLIGIPAMYALGKHITQNRFVGIICALMWAIHPFEIWHSQDFRNYAIWAGLSATSLWLGLRLIHHRKAVDWLLYGVIALITGLTFYTELLTLGALGIFVFITQWKYKHFVYRFIGLQTIIVTIVLVGFVIFQGSLLGGGGYGGNVEPFNVPDYLTRFLPTLFVGDSVPAELQGVWVSLLAAVIVLGLATYRHSRQVMILLLILILLPLLLLGIVSTRISIFHPRYVLSTVPAVILLLSIGGYSLGKYIRKRFNINQNFVMVVILSPWFVLSTIALNNYYTVTVFTKAPTWDELGNFLTNNVSEHDLVIPLSVDPAFNYYYNGAAEHIGLPDSPTQPDAEIIEELASIHSDYDSIYVVANAIPSWQNADVVENWMNENMQLVRLSSASGLGIRQYKNWSVFDGISQEPLAEFDNIVRLIDYELFDTPLPTGELVLWLYWQPIQQTDQSLKSFVHVVGDTNSESSSPLWAQDDQFPQEGRIDTTSWDSDTIYRDVYYLPSDPVIAGDYAFLVGWYDPETNSRLSTDTNNDVYTLTSLTYLPN